ncbi:phosphoglycerate mutase [Massilia sp. WF1]|uniref:histidine phosphatase family protein n=1 Tax=unclassified Massilia TaxID=2609279 RepID=UPI0006914A2E|nr:MULTISPECIES: histidine phosphatase family protein [unclassified Massilia]ALK95744.1 phosphoglycerate mutase [Massilia sp. WG5]KNZ68037.1 phosphoglycerate mutase [Massilia sp. WF1]
MNKIILIRHGETAWNAERRLQGHLDIPLNDEGERQARLLAEALAPEAIDLLVSSDLQRARQTAQAVATLRGMPLLVEPGLRERCYGGFEGLLYSEIEQRFPSEFAAWQARDIDAVLPSGKNCGESFRQFYARATEAILGLASAHPGRTLALVAHGGVLECAYRMAGNLPLETPRDFKVYNASINRFRVDGGRLVLESWGEVSHLRPALLDELA